MNTQEAKNLGQQLAILLEAGEMDNAAEWLAPVLAARNPFRFLTMIGQEVGAAQLDALNPFLRLIAEGRTEGGWVVIGGALNRQLERDLPGTFSRCREFIIDGDIWYAADSLAERVPGPALVTCFEPALSLLSSWRSNENRWVRRASGVAVHFWAKRAHGAPEQLPSAEELLNFLEPMVTERDYDAVKGVGWGLKTLGRYYPELAAGWLSRLVSSQPMRALMLHKAQTYLSPELRARSTGKIL